MSIDVTRVPIGGWLLDADPTPDVRLDEFFPPGFMRAHTRFDRFAEFRAACPRDIRDRSDIDPIDDEALDRFVAGSTRFDSWRAMVDHAAERELRDRLLP